MIIKKTRRELCKNNRIDATNHIIIRIIVPLRIYDDVFQKLYFNYLFIFTRLDRPVYFRSSFGTRYPRLSRRRFFANKP